jgi:UDP-N-acetyl-D-mannosaminuronic acid dehydrogenase
LGVLALVLFFLVEPNIDAIPNCFDNCNSNVKLVDLTQAIMSSDIVVLLVDHASFKSMDLSSLSGKKVIDTRGIWLQR